MIAQISGTLLSKYVDRVVVDVSGVGFAVSVSTSTLAAMPALGDRVVLHTFLHVREEALNLFGFASEDERVAFESLIGVGGVGPKMALAALSTFSSSELARVVEAADLTRLCEIPGVGKKVAQRLVLELKGKLQLDGVDAVDGAAQSAPESAVAALLSMGFTAAEAHTALAGYEGAVGDDAAAVRYALTRLGA